MSASDGHVAAPSSDLDPYDTCEHCRKPIRLDGAGAWVTMVGFNRECYGRKES